jgi:hypothetical protein
VSTRDGPPGILPDDIDDFLADEPQAYSVYWGDGPPDSERAGWRRLCRAVIAQAFLDACFKPGEGLPDFYRNFEDWKPTERDRRRSRGFLLGEIWPESLTLYCEGGGRSVKSTVEAARDLQEKGWEIEF